MKKLIIGTLVGIAILILTNIFSIKAGSIYKDGASIICEQKRLFVRNEVFTHTPNKQNVLYFGASDILAGLIPSVFDSVLANETSSLNLSLPALPIGPAYHTLLEYLERNPTPDYIILALHIDGEPGGLHNTYGNQGINFPSEFFNYLRYRDDRNQIINYLLPSHVYSNFIFQYAYDGIFNRENIEYLKERNQGHVDKMKEQLGYYFIMEQSTFPEGRLPVDYVAPGDCDTCQKEFLPVESDYFIRQFFNLTADLNIPVLLIETPTRAGSYAQYNDVPPTIAQIESEYENVVYNKDAGWKLKFYDNKYFADQWHLNYDGAVMYTKDVAKEFAEMFQVGIQADTTALATIE
jgi:hypothetical protein